MVNISRAKVLMIVLACALAFLFAAPNVVGNKDFLARLPGWLPSKTVSLGLDLQGGSHLLMQADIDSVIHDRTETLLRTGRDTLNKEKIGHSKIAIIPNGISVTLSDGQDPEAARAAMRQMDHDLDVSSPDPKTVNAVLGDAAIKKIQDQTIDQSIEIVRRRIDETGTREPVIQRQGVDRIIVELPGVSDPEHIKELLGRTAKLTFNLVDTKGDGVGTRNLPSQEDPTRTIPVFSEAIIKGEMLTDAQPSQDQNGQPDVSFNLNGIGAGNFCTVTREHTGEPFAIVLDGKVVSAPNINGAICGGGAIITGHFTVQQTSDLSLLLRAGALPAPLKVMEERTVGPSLGADSVAAGKKACLMALVFVTCFISLVYGLFGVFASLALLVNMVMIIAVMSLLQATLTLPGIAGIVLAIGLAVDANVLVFERIKEEIRAGRSILSAVDVGYKRARTTIIDSNLTALIAALILFSFGTGPIKGFAVTMCIGVATSYFAALMLTRLMVVGWIRWKKPKEIAV